LQHKRPPYPQIVQLHARCCHFSLQKPIFTSKYNYRKLCCFFLISLYYNNLSSSSSVSTSLCFSLLSRVSQRSCSIDILAFCPPPLVSSNTIHMEVASMPNGLCVSVSLRNLLWEFRFMIFIFILLIFLTFIILNVKFKLILKFSSCIVTWIFFQIFYQRYLKMRFLF